MLASAISDGWQAASWVYGFSIFFKPVMDDFGWTRAQTAAASSFGRVEGAVEGPFGGIATDKFGPRTVYLTGVFLAGLGFCLMYFINSLITFYIVWIIAAIGFNLGFAEPLDQAIATWFVKKRGTVISIARLGRVLGGGFLPPFVSLLVYKTGWRAAFLILGTITWVLGFFLGWFMIKNKRPEYYGLLPDGEDIDVDIDTPSMLKVGETYAAELGEYEFTARQAFKTASFWVLTGAALLSGMIFPAISVHIIPYLTDTGMDPVAAASAMGFMVLMSAPGRLLGGMVGDRLSKDRLRYLPMLSAACHMLGMLLLLMTKTMSMVYVCLIFFGLGVGLDSSSAPVLMGRYFGRKNYGTIWGGRATIGLPVTLISPIYAGWMYDVTGSYVGAFTTNLAFAAIGIAFYFFAKPPKPLNQQI